MIHLESSLEECAQEVRELILTVFSRLHTCDLNTRNHARMGTNLERARRILGMTTRPISTEDLVLVRLRATAEHEEIDGPHSEGVCEIVPMRDTNEMHGCFAVDESVDSACKVLGSIFVTVSL